MGASCWGWGWGWSQGEAGNIRETVRSPSILTAAPNLDRHPDGSSKGYGMAIEAPPCFPPCRSLHPDHGRQVIPLAGTRSPRSV
jgi:hypothetical protein